ncbi:fibronectin type III-like domain-contianing protein [Tetragenococcus osmophilus]|nr:fibronectin type III-like domain-contianing protein [Tetragenococcus osmophilus]
MKELKKYQKVEIPAHEKVDVEFVLTEKDLRFYRKDMSYGSEKGDFTVFVGPNSRDVLTENFYLE